ncbi:retrovirus-related pol polyprotein from transposon TNT 1-94 [Tanacetum coccineum]
MKASLQGKDNAIRKLKEQISQMNERRSEADRILNFKALDFQMIELTEKVTALKEQNALFQAENENVKQHYKEFVETLREIVKEARIEKPLDNALGNACFYTKQSQELLVYVNGTCPKEFNKRDKKVATTPLNRKKQVPFKETCRTSNDNTQKHVKPQKEQKTNVSVIPSTGVISSTEASGSKPRRIQRTLGSCQLDVTTRRKWKITLEIISRTDRPLVLRIENEAKTGIIGFDSIKFTYYSRSRRNDDSRFTWVKFLRSKDETPKFIIKFLKQIQVGLNKTLRYIRTDNGTEFNGLVKRRNQNLVEAARTMLIFSKAPMFLWAEAVATACYTQNRSLIHTRHNKTPYELVHDKKPNLKFLQVFGALCYHTNDSEDLGKLKATKDIRIFVGYAPNRKGHRIYTKEPDESWKQFFSGIVLNPVPVAPYVPPTNKDLEILFQPMFDEYLELPSVERPVSRASTVQVSVVSAGVAAGPTIEDNPFAQADNDPFVNVFAPEPSSEESSSRDVSSAESTQVIQPHNHLRKWSKDYPLNNVIVEPKNVKTAMDEAWWFEAMQEEIHEFDRL